MWSMDMQMTIAVDTYPIFSGTVRCVAPEPTPINAVTPVYLTDRTGTTNAPVGNLFGLFARDMAVDGTSFLYVRLGMESAWRIRFDATPISGYGSDITLERSDEPTTVHRADDVRPGDLLTFQQLAHLHDLALANGHVAEDKVLDPV